MTRLMFLFCLAFSNLFFSQKYYQISGPFEKKIVLSKEDSIKTKAYENRIESEIKKAKVDYIFSDNYINNASYNNQGFKLDLYDIFNDLQFKFKTLKIIIIVGVNDKIKDVIVEGKLSKKQSTKLIANILQNKKLNEWRSAFHFGVGNVLYQEKYTIIMQ